MSHRHAGHDGYIQWAESFPQDVTKGPACIIGCLAAIEGSEGDTAHTIKSACAHQLSDHSIDSVWNFAHVLEKQNAVFGTERPLGARQAGQDAEVSPHYFSFNRLRVATQALPWEIQDRTGVHPILK